MTQLIRNLAGLALLSSLGAGAQSLGDLARQARAQAQPAPAYTNADLPQAGDLSVVGVAPSETPAVATPAAVALLPSESPELEMQWRARFADARSALDLARKQLDVTQRELNLAQVQFYANPNVELRQETSRGDIDRLTARVASLRTEVTQHQAALAALQDELHRADLPAAWGRP